MYQFKLTQKIAIAGMLAAVAVVLGTVKIRMPGLTISFLYVPCLLGGIILGPVYGMAVGLVGDGLGTLFSGFTVAPLILLSNALIGGISGTVYKYAYVKNKYLKIIAAVFCVLFIVTYGINSYALTVPPATVYASYLLALSTRIVYQTPVVVINTVLVLLIFVVLEKTVLVKYLK